MGKRPAPRMLQSEILGAEQRRIPRNMVVLGSTLVVVCVTCFVLAVAHEANGGSFESLNENPRLEDLYHAFVYNKHPPTVSPTPVPSINLGGEPVVAPGSYVTESSNKTLSDLQLKTRKDMEMVKLMLVLNPPATTSAESSSSPPSSTVSNTICPRTLASPEVGLMGRPSSLSRP